MNEKQSMKKRNTQSGRPVIDRERRIHIGQTIRKYRTKAGMDQASLAGILGLSTTAVGSWELGVSRPDVDTVPRVCEILHIPVTELLGLPTEAALPTEDRSILDMYHQLDKFNRHTIKQLMDRLLFQQDSNEKARLRDTYRGLVLYEEAAAAGIGTPMLDDSEASTVYIPKNKIPGSANAIIHVNGTSMEPTYPHGCYVYVSTDQQVSYGQIGIFIVNGESYIKEYQPEGLVSHNGHYKTIRISDGSEARCFGLVTGIVEDGDIAAGSLLEKIETAFEEEIVFTDQS